MYGSEPRAGDLGEKTEKLRALRSRRLEDLRRLGKTP
jgi:hypothetical protein